MLPADERDHVAGLVEFPVAVSVEAVPVLALPGVREQRRNTSKPGIGSFRTATA